MIEYDPLSGNEVYERLKHMRLMVDGDDPEPRLAGELSAYEDALVMRERQYLTSLLDSYHYRAKWDNRYEFLSRIPYAGDYCRRKYLYYEGYRTTMLQIMNVRAYTDENQVTLYAVGTGEEIFSFEVP